MFGTDLHTEMFFMTPGIASVDFMSGLSGNHILQIKVGIVEDL